MIREAHISSVGVLAIETACANVRLTNQLETDKFSVPEE